MTAEEAEWITAEEMAKSAGIPAKTFREALRAEKLPWHNHYDRWKVQRNGEEHKDMQRVLEKLTKLK